LRPPAKFRVRRILRRLTPRIIVFQRENAIVLDPTRGVFFAGCSTGSQGAAPSSIHQALSAALSGADHAGRAVTVGRNAPPRFPQTTGLHRA
jgi:hypothetical protein